MANTSKPDVHISHLDANDPLHLIPLQKITNGCCIFLKTCIKLFKNRLRKAVGKAN